MTNVVYVIQNKHVANQYKIGITSNWSSRAKQLKVGDVTKEVFVCPVNENGELESYLHKRYAKYRLPQSEWFHLNSHQVGQITSIIETHYTFAEVEYLESGEPAHVINNDKYKEAWAKYYSKEWTFDINSFKDTTDLVKCIRQNIANEQGLERDKEYARQRYLNRSPITKAIDWLVGTYR
jgi:hypothetical protein